MIKVILFDVDGVIINTGLFSERLEKDFGIGLDKTLPFFKNEFRDCQLGKADLKGSLEKYLQSWEWKKSIDELIEYWFSDSKENVNIELADEINKLRSNGYKCYLATNNEKYRVNYLWENVGFKSLFDGVFASCNIGSRKPDKMFFKAVVNDLQITPGEIFFWDSDQEIVDAAKEFGMSSELYESLEKFKEVNYVQSR